MNSVASIGGLRREPLAASSYWRRLTGRLAAADKRAPSAIRCWTRCTLSGPGGDARLVMGSWHGDWTPWNMASTRGGLLVWDWERFTEGVPLGFDALHYSCRVTWFRGARTRGPPPRAASRTRPVARPVRARRQEARLTGILYLADLATRYLADRQSQAGAQLGAAGTWLIPSITDQVGRLCRACWLPPAS